MKKIVAVALCNNHSRMQDWFRSCVGTWENNLSNLEKYFVSDGSLNPEQKQEIEVISGGTFFDTEIHQEKLDSVLSKYPAIKNQRDLCVFYRRIIDFSIYFADYDYVLSIDTDIALAAPVIFPDVLPDFAFCIDEVPGYSAAPKVAFETKILTGLNAGFLIFRPSLIDFDFIEYVTDRYIRHGKVNWWSEQTCWALIAGNLCNDVRLFSPKSVAIISGFKKRSINDIQSNRTRYMTRSIKVRDLQYIQKIIGDAKVIHFAGPGKPWIKPVMENVTDRSLLTNEPEVLQLDPIPAFDWQEKALLFSRLLMQQYKYRNL